MADKKIPTWEESKPIKATGKVPTWDESKPVEVKPPSELEVGPREAQLRGAGQSFLGLGDEITAAVQYPVGAAKQVGQYFGLAEPNSPDIKAYKAERDIQRAQDELAWKQYPVDYGTGYIEGSIAQMGAGAAIGKAFPALSGAGTIPEGQLFEAQGAKAIGVGAGTAAAGAVGKSEAETLKGLSKEATVPAIVGGTLPVVGRGLQSLAGMQAAEKSGIENARKIAEANALAKGTKEVEAVSASYPSGEQLIKEGLYGSPSNIATKAAVKRSEVGKAIGDILDKPKKAFDELHEESRVLLAKEFEGTLTPSEAQRLTAVKPEFTKVRKSFYESVNDVTNKLREKAKEWVENPAMRPQLNKLNKEIDEFEILRKKMEEGSAKLGTPETLNQIKSAYDNRIYTANKQLKGTEAFSVIRDALKEQVKTSLDALKPGLGSKELEELNNIIDAAATQSKKSSEAGINAWDGVTSALGYALSGPKGIAIGAAKAAQRTPLGVTATYSLGEALPKISGQAGGISQQLISPSQTDSETRQAQALNLINPNKYPTVESALQYIKSKRQ